MQLKIFSAVLVVVLVSVGAFFFWPKPPVHYSAYTDIVSKMDSTEGCTGMQGFGVGTVYAYSVKVNTGKLTKAEIYRTALADGTTQRMTNGDDGLGYCTYLSHANDMALCTIDGQDYMFIVTMLEGEMSMVKLRYEDTTYYKEGNYTIKLGSITKSMSGVDIVRMDADSIQFLFKNGKTYYKGSLPLTANSGEVIVEQAFVLNVTDALVDGSPVPDIAHYANQGFEYYKDAIFHPMTRGNVSIVLVYRNISKASGTITADPKLSFRITSEEYAKLFEMEGVGHGPDGRLYFNTNRNTPDGTQYDGVHYFNDYKG